MSRFRDELRVIPLAGWWIASILWVGGALALMFGILLRAPDALRWPAALKLLFAAGVPIPLVVYILLVSYVWGDARRRGMRAGLWMLLAIVIPNGIGIILYFVLRDPLLSHCTGCGTEVRSGFAYCPVCGTSLAPSCPQCRRVIERGWRNCAYCGAQL